MLSDEEQTCHWLDYSMSSPISSQNFPSYIVLPVSVNGFHCSNLNLHASSVLSSVKPPHVHLTCLISQFFGKLSSVGTRPPLTLYMMHGYYEKLCMLLMKVNSLSFWQCKASDHNETSLFKQCRMLTFHHLPMQAWQYRSSCIGQRF